MRLKNVELTNFRVMESAKVDMQGKSAVIFGINGTGKSSILRAINLLYANIINQIVNRKELKQSYVLQLDDIQYGKKETKIEALLDFGEETLSYYRGMVRHTGKRYQDISSLKKIVEIFHEKYITDIHKKICLFLSIMAQIVLYWTYL